MNDAELVRNSGIKSAIIVDDGYDETPAVEELINESSWESLFDDAQDAQADRIKELFSDYESSKRTELKSNQEFINALWEGRESIRDLLNGLFDDYENKLDENRPSLDAVESALDALEIEFQTSGRDFVEVAVDADLIIIDLFLGIRQSIKDREITVDNLRKVIKGRNGRPLPSIILMSQIPKINDLASQFRQDVELHASAFRHISKNDLSKPGRLERLVITLASHRSDSQALANFVETWEAKAIDAVGAATGTLRKIDIDDLQHIHNLLLRFEGLNTSSYLLDVFDRVLQYEIESHDAVLEAARQLDTINGEPAPLMISSERDTFTILEQTLFVNPNRRNHVTGAEWPVAFGDILAPRQGKQIPSNEFFSNQESIVFLVASPQCDLIRKGGLKTALLVTGTVKKIGLESSELSVTSKTTSVLRMAGNERFQVDWDFGDLRTISLEQANCLLNEDKGNLVVIATLRDGPALNLRQQLLANMGRVGDLAPLPRSWRFRADIHYPLKTGKLHPIALPDNVEITGNVLLPRRGKYAAAIVDSNCEDDLTEAMLKLDIETVAPRSARKFKILKEQTRLRQIFRSGFQYETPIGKCSPMGLLKPDEKQPATDDKKPKTDAVGTVVLAEIQEELTALDKFQEEAGLILRVYEESNN